MLGNIFLPGGNNRRTQAQQDLEPKGQKGCDA